MNLTIDSSSILLCTQPVDFRKSIDGLIDIVAAALGRAPEKGILIFYNQTQTKLKILAWHHNGFVFVEVIKTK